MGDVGSGFSSAAGIFRSLCSPPPPPSAGDSDSSLPEFLFSLAPPPPADKPAFVDASSGRSLSFADLRRLSGAAASALSALGLRRGHLALLLSPNSLPFPALALSVLSLGALLSTPNPLLTPSELHALVLDSSPFLVLATLDLAPKLRSLRTPLPLLVLVEPFLSSLRLNPGPIPIPAVRVSPHDPATLMYSSGTTGKSKGVVATHRNLVAMARVLRHVWGSEEHVYGCAVPLFHMFGFSVFVCGAIAAGATTVMVGAEGRRFAAEEVMRAVAAHRVTRLPAVPPMVVQMARAARKAQHFDLSSLREVISSGAPLARQHLERFGMCFPLVRLSQVYSTYIYICTRLCMHAYACMHATR